MISRSDVVANGAKRAHDDLHSSHEALLRVRQRSERSWRLIRRRDDLLLNRWRKCVGIRRVRRVTGLERLHEALVEPLRVKLWSTAVQKRLVEAVIGRHSSVRGVHSSQRSVEFCATMCWYVLLSSPFYTDESVDEQVPCSSFILSSVYQVQHMAF